MMDWKPVQSREDLQQLALQTMDWAIAQTPTGVDSEQKSIQQLSEPLTVNHLEEDRKLFSGWVMVGEYWGYVRVGMNGEELVLLDFARKKHKQMQWFIYCAGLRKPLKN